MCMKVPDEGPQASTSHIVVHWLSGLLYDSCRGSLVLVCLAGQTCWLAWRPAPATWTWTEQYQSELLRRLRLRVQLEVWEQRQPFQVVPIELELHGVTDVLVFLVFFFPLIISSLPELRKSTLQVYAKKFEFFETKSTFQHQLLVLSKFATYTNTWKSIV